MSLASHLSRDRDITVLHGSSLVTLGEFHCRPDDPRWSRPNCADEGHFVVFPGTVVTIAQDGREPVVADPHQIVFYNRYQSYRRELVSPEGDHCIFLVVAPSLIEEIAQQGVQGLGDAERQPFHWSHAYSTGDVYLAHWLLVAEAKRDPTDHLALEERLVLLVDRAIRRLVVRAQHVQVRRLSTRRVHRELVEDAKRMIGAHLGDRLTLDGIAAEVASSPYHLARVFRAYCGSSLHAYRDELRLRTSLGLVGDPARGELTRIAVDLGYVSLSHFSDRFRRRFGVPPSVVRHWAKVGALSQLRMFLKAEGASAA